MTPGQVNANHNNYHGVNMAWQINKFKPRSPNTIFLQECCIFLPYFAQQLFFSPTPIYIACTTFAWHGRTHSPKATWENLDHFTEATNLKHSKEISMRKKTIIVSGATDDCLTDQLPYILTTPFFPTGGSPSLLIRSSNGLLASVNTHCPDNHVTFPFWGGCHCSLAQNSSI